MERRKAIVVTAICAVLLAGLWLCLSKISYVAFAALTGTMAAAGFGFAAVAFCRWIGKAPKEPVDKLELPALRHEVLEPITAKSPAVAVEDIIAEVRGA